MTQTFPLHKATDAARFAENCARCLHKIMYVATRGKRIIVSEKPFSGATAYFPL